MCALCSHIQQIATEYEVGCATNRPALDFTEYGLRALPDTHEATHVVAHELVVAHRIPGTFPVRWCIRAIGHVPATAIGEIVTCRQGVTGTPQYDGGNARRSARPVDRVCDAIDDRLSQRILFRWPIERDNGDTITLLIQNNIRLGCVGAHR